MSLDQVFRGSSSYDLLVSYNSSSLLHCDLFSSFFEVPYNSWFQHTKQWETDITMLRSKGHKILVVYYENVMHVSYVYIMFMYVWQHQQPTKNSIIKCTYKQVVPVGFVPSPYFEAVCCFICGRRRVAVARYRMICFVLANVVFITFIVQIQLKKYREVLKFIVRESTTYLA